MDTASALGGRCAGAPHRAAVQRPAGTLTIPRPLTHDLHDVPHAIGIYVLVVRLYAIHQRPLPLSAADLQTYDPQLTYGQARRSLQRLVRTRWLIPQQTAGHKAHYLPTWGEGRAWDTQGAARLGPTAPPGHPAR